MNNFMTSIRILGVYPYQESQGSSDPIMLKALDPNNFTNVINHHDEYILGLTYDEYGTPIFVEIYDFDTILIKPYNQFAPDELNEMIDGLYDRYGNLHDTIEDLDFTLSDEDRAAIVAEVEASIEPPVIDDITKAEIVGQITESIEIPTKVSELENDSEFITNDNANFVLKTGDTMTGSLTVTSTSSTVSSGVILDPRATDGVSSLGLQFNSKGDLQLNVAPFSVKQSLTGFRGAGNNYQPIMKFSPSVILDGIQDPYQATQAASKHYVDNLIPTKTSDLENDSGFITIDDIDTSTIVVPVKTSELENDSGFITADDISSSIKNIWYGKCESTGAIKDIITTTGDFSNTVGNILIVDFLRAQVGSSQVTYTIDNVSGWSVYRRAGDTSNNVYASWGEAHTEIFVVTGDKYLTQLPSVAGARSYGVVRLSDAIDSTNSEINGSAATPYAVKQVYDLATANANVIESISVNSIAQEIIDKNVNIRVPTTTSELTNNSDFTTKEYVDNAVSSAAGSTTTTATTITTNNAQDANSGGYVLFSGYSGTRTKDTLYKTRDVSVGASSSGIIMYLGSATDGNTNQHGSIALQASTDNTVNHYNTIKSTPLTEDVSQILPAAGGTILNTSTTKISDVRAAGPEIGTLTINNTETVLHAPENISAFNNDAGYITSEQAPSVGFLPIPITYDTDTVTFTTSVDFAALSRWDIPIGSYNGEYFYLNKNTGESLTLINFPRYMDTVMGYGDGSQPYGFLLNSDGTISGLFPEMQQ